LPVTKRLAMIYYRV